MVQREGVSWPFSSISASILVLFQKWFNWLFTWFYFEINFEISTSFPSWLNSLHGLSLISITLSHFSSKNSSSFLIQTCISFKKNYTIFFSNRCRALDNSFFHSRKSLLFPPQRPSPPHSPPFSPWPSMRFTRTNPSSPHPTRREPSRPFVDVFLTSRRRSHNWTLEWTSTDDSTRKNIAPDCNSSLTKWARGMIRSSIRSLSISPLRFLLSQSRNSLRTQLDALLIQLRARKLMYPRSPVLTIGGFMKSVMMNKVVLSPMFSHCPVLNERQC